MSQKKSIQCLLNTYLEKFGSIDLLLPDGVGLEIGITQQSKHGLIKQDNYCWVITSRDDRAAIFDRYSMSMTFEETKNRIVDQADDGVVYVI